MSKFVSQDNMTSLINAIKDKFDEYEGAYIIKGSVAFSGLPATPTVSQIGYVYNVSNSFTTDSRFVEGAGHEHAAGANVVIINAGDATTPDVKYDVLESFIDVTSITNRIDAVAGDLVSATFGSGAYAVGDIVKKDDVLYRFTSAHTAGDPWTPSEVEAVTVVQLLGEIETGSTTIINNIESAIADDFDTSETYHAGDLVIYNNTLYQFTDDHTGAWDASDVTAVSINDVVDALDTALSSRIDTLVGDLTQQFSASTAYAVGDVVVYQDQIYKFKTAHAAGAWVGTDADAVTLLSLVNSAEPEPLSTADVNALIALLG